MNYPLTMEVAGPLAMFARPDTGGTPTSYPAPTWSACKGLFESIALFADGSAWICPTKVEICRWREQPGGNVRFQKYATNYGGPQRKPQLIAKGANMQLFATVLVDVCYRIHAEVRGVKARDGINSRHHLQDLFNRRLLRGQCHHTPALGWREFTCSYWGGFRDDTVVDEKLDLMVPSMLVTPWDQSIRGTYAHRFAHGVRVEKGVLTFAQ